MPSMDDKKLVWDDRLGMGFVDDDPGGIYGLEYWKECQRRETTVIGQSLVHDRWTFVDKHLPPNDYQVLDVGIGGGEFLRWRSSSTRGYDVNPYAIRWLLEQDKWRDPHFRHVRNATFWDSLEHMMFPGSIMACVTKTAFISIPIFRDKDHLLGSKHFKIPEHLWYFTEDGLIRWMKHQGFSLLEKNRMEEDLGREDIGTFAFTRDIVK